MNLNIALTGLTQFCVPIFRLKRWKSNLFHFSTKSLTRTFQKISMICHLKHKIWENSSECNQSSKKQSWNSSGQYKNLSTCTKNISMNTSLMYWGIRAKNHYSLISKPKVTHHKSALTITISPAKQLLALKSNLLRLDNKITKKFTTQSSTMSTQWSQNDKFMSNWYKRKR